MFQWGWLAVVSPMWEFTEFPWREHVLNDWWKFAHFLMAFFRQTLISVTFPLTRLSLIVQNWWTSIISGNSLRNGCLAGNQTFWLEHVVCLSTVTGYSRHTFVYRRLLNQNDYCWDCLHFKRLLHFIVFSGVNKVCWHCRRQPLGYSLLENNTSKTFWNVLQILGLLDVDWPPVLE